MLQPQHVTALYTGPHTGVGARMVRPWPEHGQVFSWSDCLAGRLWDGLADLVSVLHHSVALEPVLSHPGVHNSPTPLTAPHLMTLSHIRWPIVGGIRALRSRVVLYDIVEYAMPCPMDIRNRLSASHQQSSHIYYHHLVLKMVHSRWWACMVALGLFGA